MQRVLLFVNPVFDQRQSQRQALADIAAWLKREGCAVEVLQSLSAQSAGEQAREAAAAGFDTVFVCGGDGTFFRALQGLAGAAIPVGILPFGTGNVLVQNLQLPRDPVEAVRRLLRAPARPIPLGRITCHRTGHLSAKSYVFMIAAGMGLHASLMHAAQSGSKSVGGRAAYYWGGVRLLLGHPVEPFDVEITDAGGQVTRRQAAELIAVRVGALNRWRPAGDLHQPLLRLAVVPPTTRLGLAHASYRALMGKPAPPLGQAQGAGASDAVQDASQPRGSAKSLPTAAYYDATRVVCRAIANYPYKAKILTEADGEVLGDSSAVLEMADGKLNLLWPE